MWLLTSRVCLLPRSIVPVSVSAHVPGVQLLGPAVPHSKTYSPFLFFFASFATIVFLFFSARYCATIVCFFFVSRCGGVFFFFFFFFFFWGGGGGGGGGSFFLVAVRSVFSRGERYSHLCFFFRTPPPA